MRECQAVDLLVVIVIFVLLPMGIEVKAIGATIISSRLSPW